MSIPIRQSDSGDCGATALRSTGAVTSTIPAVKCQLSLKMAALPLVPQQPMCSFTVIQGGNGLSVS